MAHRFLPIRIRVNPLTKVTTLSRESCVFVECDALVEITLHARVLSSSKPNKRIFLLFRVMRNYRILYHRRRICVLVLMETSIIE